MKQVFAVFLRTSRFNEFFVFFIYTSTSQMLEKLTNSYVTLDSGTTVIRPVKSVHDLGIHLDNELTVKTHVSKVSASVTNSFAESPRLAGSLGKISCNSWFKHLFDHNLTIATHCCLISQVNHLAFGALSRACPVRFSITSHFMHI